MHSITNRFGTGVLLGCLLAVATLGAAEKSWQIESPAMRLVLEADGALTLEDKAIGTRWSSAVPGEPKVSVTAATVETGATALQASLKTDGEPWQLRLRSHDTEATLDLELSAPDGRALPGDLAYPFPWRAPSADWRAVLPQKTGVMFRPADAAIFLDVTASNPLREDWHAKRLLDRTADRAQRIALLNYTTAQGVVTGTEDGYGWAAPHVDYLEGMTMPRRFDYMPGITVGNYTEPFALSDEYKQIDLNEAVRVPLWDLVFHDSVVSTWRWNFGRNRYADAAYWDKHDLLEILIGNMPIFVLNAGLARTHGARLAKTFRDVCTWQGRVGWDELVDHRALTTDRSVQESRFSSGWSVTVNFSDRPQRMPDGSTLGTRSFTTTQSNPLHAPITHP